MNAERRVHLQHGITDTLSEIPTAADPAAGSRFRAGISLARAGDMALSRRYSLPCRERLLADLGI